MTSSRTFSDVSSEILARIKEFGSARYRIAFDPPDGAHSTVVGETPFGRCIIESVYDSERAELTLTIVEKPWLLPESLLWNGFSETLERCREDN